MICKKCGKEIKYSYFTVTKKHLHQQFENMSDEINDIYKDYPCLYACKECYEGIDYKDMEVGMFFTWLDMVSEKESKYMCDKNIKGKALIRYFGLDELFLQKVGDSL